MVRHRNLTASVSHAGKETGEEGSYGMTWLWEVTFPWLPSPDLPSSPNPTLLCTGPCSEGTVGTLKRAWAPLGYDPVTSVQKQVPYWRGGWGIGSVTWSCRTLVSLCLRLVCSVMDEMHVPEGLQSTALPGKPLSLSCSHQVSEWALSFILQKGVINTAKERRSHWPRGKPWRGDGAGGIGKQWADASGTRDLPVT